MGQSLDTQGPGQILAVMELTFRGGPLLEDILPSWLAFQF